MAIKMRYRACKSKHSSARLAKSIGAAAASSGTRGASAAGAFSGPGKGRLWAHCSCKRVYGGYIELVYGGSKPRHITGVAPPCANDKNPILGYQWIPWETLFSDKHDKFTQKSMNPTPPTTWSL